MSAMVAKKYTLEEATGDCSDCDLWIAPELLSKEPLGAVRDMDSDWKDVVTWVWFGMVTAEEMGIDSENYMDADTSNPAVDRLLNQNLGLGTDANPLPATWMQMSYPPPETTERLGTTHSVTVPMTVPAAQAANDRMRSVPCRYCKRSCF